MGMVMDFKLEKLLKFNSLSGSLSHMGLSSEIGGWIFGDIDNQRLSSALSHDTLSTETLVPHWLPASYHLKLNWKEDYQTKS